MRLLDNHLAVVDHHIAKASGQIHQARSKSDIVDGPARTQHSIFDFGHIDNSSITQDDIDVGVFVHHHEVVLVAIVIDIGNAHIAQLVYLTQGLILLSGLIQAKEVFPRLVINPFAGFNHRGHRIAHKRRVNSPITNGILCHCVQ